MKGVSGVMVSLPHCGLSPFKKLHPGYPNRRADTKMICPKCQTEITGWQFYCPQCRTSLQDYNELGGGFKRGALERVGGQLINLIIILFLIGGSVLVARQIDWKELIAMFRDPGAGYRTGQPAPDNPANRRRRSRTREKSTVNRPSDPASDGSQASSHP